VAGRYLEVDFQDGFLALVRDLGHKSFNMLGLRAHSSMQREVENRML